MRHTIKMDKDRRSFRSEIAAKFWREHQEQPTDWIIMPPTRGEYCVQYIGAIRHDENSKK